MADGAALLAGHDDEARRWLGQADIEPRPYACIVVDGQIAGWVDYDVGREWLLPGEINVGYSVFAARRGRGYASRAVQLLMHHLALEAEFHTATLLIHRDNERSLALPARIDFVPSGEMGKSFYFKRSVPVFPYTDGVVTLRRLESSDLERHLEAIDEEQIRWLWEPGRREDWESKSADEQRLHQLRYLVDCEESFGSGPHWRFAVDAEDADYVVYVDCDLANPRVPPGEANISYTAHPVHRGKGFVSRAVRLVMEFLRENTGAREAHLVIDTDNVSSLRVARAVAGHETERFVNEHGRTMIRHVRRLRPT